KRLLWMIPTMVIISFISFSIIQLPPGDYLTSYIAALGETGETVDEAQAAALRARYNLDQPFMVQYWRWLAGMVQGDLGMSFEWNRPVTELIGERILLTSIISIVTLLVTWALAIPVGIYSAVKQYSLPDYCFTFLGFIGLATPNFLLALVFMYIGYSVFGVSAGGLFSPEYQNAVWSFGKFLDLLGHLWIPVIVIGTSGTAGLIRVMRGNLLDELRKQYVMTARAKGVRYWVLLMRYPVRVALNPLVSTVGWVLPGIVSGATITSVVLGLPTTGPLLLRALMNQDMYLAGSMVMMLSLLTLVGTLISDILLLWLDPRIRYEEGER
ncbi:MAG: ABC transporter permease, partial [Gemmatimonadota bacterium]|nr:ABC transporter permease [Gemmatimonadota bacterium]